MPQCTGLDKLFLEGFLVSIFVSSATYVRPSKLSLRDWNTTHDRRARDGADRDRAVGHLATVATDLAIGWVLVKLSIFCKYVDVDLTFRLD